MQMVLTELRANNLLSISFQGSDRFEDADPPIKICKYTHNTEIVNWDFTDKIDTTQRFMLITVWHSIRMIDICESILLGKIFIVSKTKKFQIKLCERFRSNHHFT